MTRYAASQIALAFILAGLGFVKGYRLAWDQIDDALSNMAGLS